MHKEIINHLKQIANPKIAQQSQKFFKTGVGEYWEWDKFLGIKVPELRKLAKQNIETQNKDISKLLENKYHEIRLLWLFILLYQFQKSNPPEQKEIFDFYLKHLKSVNNWDLVDTTTPHIIGKYLLLNPDEDRGFLYKLAESENLWERRISILATHAFIREKQFLDTLKLAEVLLLDKHDLIHKAVGWMLRELWKKDEEELLDFLDKYSENMPRTMLRYAIEKLDEDLRRYYMKR